MSSFNNLSRIFFIMYSYIIMINHNDIKYKVCSIQQRFIILIAYLHNYLFKYKVIASINKSTTISI